LGTRHPYAMTPELERATGFEDALHEAAAERVVHSPLGIAYFNDTLPRIWAANTFQLARAQASVDEIVGEADRLQGAAGLAHRRVTIADESAGRALEPGFTELGWKTDAFLYMVPRGNPEKDVDTSAVEEVGDGALRPVRGAIHREWLKQADEETLRQLAEAERLIATNGNARHFAIVRDGRPVSGADLYSDGRVAQIEDVVTLPEHRGQGLASAVVMRALEEARAAGHEFVFLVADARDWPKELYRRLGFEGIGERYAFLLSEHAP
jgi:ribosomal protein S18 acetylase RimI-like enzyme